MSTVYNPAILADIPSLEIAHKKVTSNKGLSSFLSDFRIIAAKHDLNDCYGVTLVHRHANVSKDQRLMDFKQTLQPFPVKDDAQDLHGHPIRPKSFALAAGVWQPYEFELGELEALEDGFLTQIRECINYFGLPYVGLRRYSPADPEELEITEKGGMSVRIPWDSVSSRLVTSWR